MVAEARAVAVPSAAAIVEKVVIEGDLSKLSAAERIGYYRHMCETLGIEPMLRPFEYLMLNGKLVLYANKQGASQLRDKRNVSIGKPDITFADDLVTVAVEARLPDGRTDAELGVVSVAGLKGEAKANAILKAVTKAKRRVTLSICGLGMLDETEVQDVADARPVRVDMATGEVQKPAPAVDVTWENVASEPEHEEQKPEERTCPIHGDVMYRREKDGKVWWSHKQADAPNGWCYGKPPKPAVQPVLDGAGK